MTKFTMTNFELDGTPQFKGYTTGSTWNGWQCPYFTKSEADKIAEFMTDGEFMHIHYQEKFDRYIVMYTHEDYIEEPESYWGTTITVDNEEIKVYCLGGNSWCWDRSDRN